MSRATEKNVQRLTCTDLASKEYECEKDEADFVMGKDSYNFFQSKIKINKKNPHIFFQLHIGWHTSSSWVNWLLCLYAVWALYVTLTNRRLAHAHSESVVFAGKHQLPYLDGSSTTYRFSYVARRIAC